MDQAALAHQSVLRHQRECGEDSNLDRRVGVRAVANVRKRLELETSLYQILQILSVTLFEKVPILRALEASDFRSDLLEDRNQLILFNF